MMDLQTQQIPNVPRIKDFFLARQPILNRDQGLTAYELLFRRAAVNAADVMDDLSATASVIAHAAELGLENAVGGLLAFVNVDAAVLMSEVIEFLPADKVVLEILETVQMTPDLMARVTQLSEAGYSFAMDDVVADSEALQGVLPLIRIVKVDITGLSKASLARLARQLRPSGVLLLAEKVETLEEFNTCLELGFDYFQGYYFAKPVVLTGKKLDPSQLAIMRLLTMLVTDAETHDVERIVKEDAALGITLLRLANTPAVGGAAKIDTLGRALAVLGRRRLQQWLHILLYAEPNAPNSFLSPLLVLATTRGKLMELIAARLRPGGVNFANTAFTVGIMSLMDTLFCQPMEEILQRFAVVDEVSDALLYRRGFQGDLLALACCLERVEDQGEELIGMLEKLSLPAQDLHALQMEALDWSNSVARLVD